MIRYTTEPTPDNRGYRICRNGQPITNVQFGNQADADRYAALREIRELGQTMGIVLDMDDGELLRRIRRIVVS